MSECSLAVQGVEVLWAEVGTAVVVLYGDVLGVVIVGVVLVEGEAVWVEVFGAVLNVVVFWVEAVDGVVL